MTTPEHALVGIHIALAAGVHQRFGWVAVALAGFASIVPDWDGLPMLFDMARFEAGHRVWGHNAISILATSGFLAWTQSRFRWLEFFGRKLSAFLPSDVRVQPKNESCAALVLFVVAMVVQVVHLPCDIVVSGGKGLTDWPTQPFWPFSDAGFVLALIPWGDVGPTVILMIGVVVSAKYPARTRVASMVTLVSLCLYLIVRGKMRGVI